VTTAQLAKLLSVKGAGVSLTGKFSDFPVLGNNWLGAEEVYSVTLAPATPLMAEAKPLVEMLRTNNHAEFEIALLPPVPLNVESITVKLPSRC